MKYIVRKSMPGAFQLEEAILRLQDNEVSDE
jgi:hypothetical protein